MLVPSFRRLVARVVVGALAVVTPVLLAPVAASAEAPTDLLISEYVEGSGNNKAVEVYNGTAAAVDLTAGGYTLQQYSNGSTTAGLTIGLTGTVAAGATHVLAYTGTSTLPADPALLAAADQTSTSAFYNGDDAVVLRRGGATGTVLDVVGQVGVDPGTAWASGTTSTVNATLRRKVTVCVGDTDGGNAFDPAAEWDGYAVDTFDGLGAHTTDCGPVTPPADAAPTVASVTPDAGSTVAVGTTPTVTFSEAVTAPDSAFGLTCAGAVVTFEVSGGPTTYTLDPTADLPAGVTCTVTVSGSAVSDADTLDPPDTMVDDHTWSFGTAVLVDRCTVAATQIGAVQGSGQTSPVVGQTRTVRGVVVGDFEGASPALRGFYVQDSGDGDPATSDGIFVFNGGNQDVVRLGDVVTVTGAAGENQGQTQISTDATRIGVCDTGTVEPTEVSLPVSSTLDLERHEGMLVTYPQDLYVTEHFQLGRFGQVTVSGGDRLHQPTNVVAPGAPALALQAQNDLDRIIVDDASQAQNPDPIVFGRGGRPLSAPNTLRGGDTVAGLTGVLDVHLGRQRGQPQRVPDPPGGRPRGRVRRPAANPRPAGRSDVGGDVQVGGDEPPEPVQHLLRVHPRASAVRPPTAGAPGTRPSSTARSRRPSPRSGRSTPTSSASTRSRTTATARRARSPSSWTASTRHGARHVRLRRRRRGGGSGQRARHRRHQGRHALQALRRHADRHDGRPQHRGLRQRWRPGPAQPSVAGPGVRGHRDRRHLRRRRQPPEVQGRGLCPTRPEDGQGNCNLVRTRGPGAGRVAGRRPDGHRRERHADPRRPQLVREGGPDPTLERPGTPTSFTVRRRQGVLLRLRRPVGLPRPRARRAGMVGQVTGVAEYHINADEPSVLDYNTDFKSISQVESLYAPDEFRVSDHDPIIVGLQPNTAPSVTAAFDDTAVSCGPGSASLTVDVGDRDAGDTHEVTVAWGDGTAGTTVDPAPRPLTLSHTYGAAGRYTATVTVTDSHGLVSTTTAQVTVEYATTGLIAPFKGGAATARVGATVPVKVAFTDCDGSSPTDLDPVVTVSAGGTAVGTGTVMTLVEGEWVHELRTTGLAPGTYTVRVTVPKTGQSLTGTLRLRW